MECDQTPTTRPDETGTTRHATRPDRDDRDRDRDDRDRDDRDQTGTEGVGDLRCM